MDLQLTPQHLKFRDELRAWLKANIARPWREELRDPKHTEDSLMELRRAWQGKLYKAGYLGMDWPSEWGGRGATEVEKSLFEAELVLADACTEHGRMSGAVREKLARLIVENEVMRANGVRTLANFADGKVPGPESSIEKIYWSEFDKRFRDTALDILGPGGQLLRTSPDARPDVDWAREFLWSRAGTIYSGSSEIQRNIIAKRVLGLPQDPR